jgi:hypothetical protein
MATVYRIATLLGDEPLVWLDRDLADVPGSRRGEMTGQIVLLTPTRWIVADVEAPTSARTWHRKELTSIAILGPQPENFPDGNPSAHLAPNLLNSDDAWSDAHEMETWTRGTALSLYFGPGIPLVVPLPATRGKDVLRGFSDQVPGIIADLSNEPQNRD